VPPGMLPAPGEHVGADVGRVHTFWCVKCVIVSV
jgi:hypothetical protein